MKAFLLVGGHGERLRPITYHLPKCLVPIGGVPLLSRWLDTCCQHGVTSVLINPAARHRDAVSAFLDSRRTAVPPVTVVYEDEPVGNAGAVLANRGFVEGDDHFFVIYGDNLTNADLTAMSRLHQTHDAPLTVALFRSPTPHVCGIVSCRPDGIIAEFHEKPAHPSGNLANAGLYLARRALLDEIPRASGIVDFGRDVLPRLVGCMHGFLIDGYLVDIGTPAGLGAAEKTVAP